VLTLTFELLVLSPTETPSSNADEANPDPAAASPEPIH